MITIDIWTDGACKGNPGPGGFAYKILYGGYTFVYAEGNLSTTNNRMEVNAVLTAFRALQGIEIDNKLEYTFNVYSDSKYVTDAINKNWLFNWFRKDFYNVKNSDIWVQFYNAVTPLMLMSNVTVNFIWVKGHDGNPDNEFVDKLASNSCGYEGILANYGIPTQTEDDTKSKLNEKDLQKACKAICNAATKSRVNM